MPLEKTCWLIILTFFYWDKKEILIEIEICFVYLGHSWLNLRLMSFLTTFISVGFSDYLIILVLRGAFISHICLGAQYGAQTIFVRHILFVIFVLKIHVTITWIKWTAFQTKLRPNLMFLFYKNKMDALNDIKYRFNQLWPYMFAWQFLYIAFYSMVWVIQC